jgi:hypothetical protein
MSTNAQTAKSFGDKTDDGLWAVYMASEAHIKAQNEIAEHIFGMVARRDGEPKDKTKSRAWQRGWAGRGLKSRPCVT